ncbi:MAG TPA: hypothetical protein VJT73_18760 [Polyangiaceae bacterium]|nr:hypothetical protein [Polyangiaceae bacterium]
MAHFQPPSDGLLGQYDIDSKLAPGSVWRMAVGLSGDGAEIALHGGRGLTVRSNNPAVVANPLPPERTDGDLRVIRLKGKALGVTMLEAGIAGSKEGTWAPGSPWVSLQVQVKATLNVGPVGDPFIVLTGPHMAINAFDTPTPYRMKYTRTIAPGTPLPTVISKIIAVGRLKHLVVSCHGEILFDRSTGVITDSVIHVAGQNYRGFDRSNIPLFEQLRPTLGGGVIWFGSCAIGSDNVANHARARASGCYIVAPYMYMSPRPGKANVCPLHAVDMFTRFQPKVFAPNGTLIAYPDFLAMKQLGIRV